MIIGIVFWTARTRWLAVKSKRLIDISYWRTNLIGLLDIRNTKGHSTRTSSAMWHLALVHLSLWRIREFRTGLGFSVEKIHTSFF